MKKQYFVCFSLFLVIESFALTTTVNDEYVNVNFITDRNLEDGLRTSAWQPGFNYTMIENYSYSWIEINETGTEFQGYYLNADDGWNSTSFSDNGWSFTFYGTEYTDLNISTNGWMTFTKDSDDTIYDYGSNPSFEVGNIPTNCSLVDSANHNDTVFLLATDLDPSSGGQIFYQFFGTAPNRYLVIEYFEVDEITTNEKQTMEAIYYENGDIKLQYKNIVYSSGWIEPAAKVGLDHGDLVNYNVYTNNWTDTHSSIDVSARAVYFRLDELPDGGDGEPPGLDPLLLILAITIPSVIGVVVIGLGIYFKKNPEKLKSLSKKLRLRK